MDLDLNPLPLATQSAKKKVSFLDLPFQIRFQIYALALSYSSGYFHPLPQWGDSIEGVLRTPSGQIRYNLFEFEPPFYVTQNLAPFTLMRTCKQLSSEASNAFYELNTFAIPDISSLVLQFHNLSSFLIPRIRHIWLGLSFKSDPNWTVRALETLYAWTTSPDSVLKTITINVAACDTELQDLILECNSNHRLFKLHLMALSSSHGDEFPAWATKGVSRRLEVYAHDLTYNLPLSHRSSSPCTKKCSGTLFTAKSPLALAHTLHEAFVGELWIGDRLCFKDGEKLRETFAVDKEGQCTDEFGRWNLAWFREEDEDGRAWRWITVFGRPKRRVRKRGLECLPVAWQRATRIGLVR